MIKLYLSYQNQCCSNQQALFKKNYKNQNCFDKTLHDPSTVKCYNHQKIGNYAKNCLDSKN